MLLPVARWPAPGAHLCRRCTRQLFLAPQRRHVTGKAFAKYGVKMTAKMDKADAEWAEKAERIKRGEEKGMWDIFEERGFIKDVAGNPEDIRTLLRDKRIGAYMGVDPTAASLHVGHLLPMMPLFWMYMHGFRAVTLLGGATGKIGDPTGRLQSREEAKSAAVAMNMVKIHYQLKKLWANVDDQARRFGYVRDWAWKRGVLQNGHWWNRLPLLEVLQRLGAGLRIGPMLSRESVKRKMTEGDGMSFAEFTYPLMQAWDWWHMYRTQGVQMQVGGSDQYGNIVTGIDAFRIIRASEPNPAMRLPTGLLHDPVGFTVPLLTDSAGNKFGKSAGNAVWLDRFLTPAYDLYGYFMRRPDDDIERLLKLFTFLPLGQIDLLMKEHAADPGKRVPHHALAYEVLTLVHGKAEADAAQAQHRALHRKPGTSPANVTGVTGGDESDKHPMTLNNAPGVDLLLPRALFDEGKVARILFAAGLVKSVSEGNRMAIQKGAYVGAAPGQKPGVNKGMLLTQVDFTPVSLWFPEDTKNFIIDDKYMVLRKGRHNVRVIEIVSDEAYAASGQTYPGQPFTGKVRQLREQLADLQEQVGDYPTKRSQRRPHKLAKSPPQDAPAGARVDNDGQLAFPESKSPEMYQLEQQIEQALVDINKKMNEE